MFHLGRYWRLRALAQRRRFRGHRPCIDTAAAAIVAGSDPVLDHCMVVNVVNEGDVYVIYGLVISERVAVPVTTLITTSHVSKTVIDSTVETDVLSPITVMPSVVRALPTPIWRSP
jgi:hypothetical protein